MARHSCEVYWYLGGPDTHFPLPEGVQRISRLVGTVSGESTDMEETARCFIMWRSNYQSYPFDSGFYYLTSPSDRFCQPMRASRGTVSCSKSGGIEGYIKTSHLQAGEYVIGIGSPELALARSFKERWNPLEIYPNPASPGNTFVFLSQWVFEQTIETCMVKKYSNKRYYRQKPMSYYYLLPISSDYILWQSVIREQKRLFQPLSCLWINFLFIPMDITRFTCGRFFESLTVCRVSIGYHSG